MSDSEGGGIVCSQESESDKYFEKRKTGRASISTSNNLIIYYQAHSEGIAFTEAQRSSNVITATE